ncbi:SMP-30/gluconolactonase/LRE family protein [Cesiribacter sp. SM1]|uniref:SMP-30/gluconolactonase/LRE family protein n=1 Tax=Cesiribacter sp. SM1 TaxID=2861196 RepID=UPI001CD59BBE|nr:SMP-30/gluconolactonase/LRE family protein [Cesiribacter sp. SM1]
MNQAKAALLFVGTLLTIFLPGAGTAQMTDNNSIVAKGAKLEKLGAGYTFTEGPAADRVGNVYFTDQPNNEIIRWDAATGQFSTFSDEAGRSNGMYFDKNGNLISCADEHNQLWMWDMKGNSTVLLTDYQGKLLNGPNDLWIHPGGGMYITDPLYKREYWERDAAMQQDGQHVYYLSPDRSRFFKVDEALEQPNGIIGTPDGKKLYVADIGAGKTYVYDIGEGGELRNKTLFAPMGSDGMTIDEKGNVYLTGKGVTVFDKSGVQIAHIPIDADWTANVTFGGKDRQMLFITAMDAVYGLKMKVKGAR